MSAFADMFRRRCQDGVTWLSVAIGAAGSSGPRLGRGYSSNNTKPPDGRTSGISTKHDRSVVDQIYRFCSGSIP